MNEVATFGRIILSAVFVIAGIAHIPAFKFLVMDMTQRGVPMPKFVLISGTIFQIVMGIMLGMNILRPWAAVGLIIFTLASSVMMLDFWNMTGMEKERTLGAFMNNIALCGALLYIGFAAVK